jgi:hypothetical protein
MEMKRIVIILQLIVFCQSFSFAQGLITVKRPNGATDLLYTDLNAAINDCPSGSTLVLSGGTFNLSNVTNINKEVHLIGSGHVPDSTLVTGRTVIGGDILLVNGSDNSSFEGFQCGSIITCSSNSCITAATVKNIRIEKVKFSSFASVCHSCNLGSYATNSSNFLITKCIFLDAAFYNAQNVEVTNSIILGKIFHLNGFANISNNIFLGNPSQTFGHLHSVKNSTVENNIFRGTYVYSGNYDGTYEFQNLLEGAWINILGYSSGNISNTSLSSIFTNYSDANATLENVYLLDLHIQSGSAAKGQGRDSKDLGIYGGNSYLAKPSIPNIDSKNVAKQTNAQGELPVNFQVTARN